MRPAGQAGGAEAAQRARPSRAGRYQAVGWPTPHDSPDKRSTADEKMPSTSFFSWSSFRSMPTICKASAQHSPAGTAGTTGGSARIAAAGPRPHARTRRSCTRRARGHSLPPVVACRPAAGCGASRARAPGQPAPRTPSWKKRRRCRGQSCAPRSCAQFCRCQTRPWAARPWRRPSCPAAGGESNRQGAVVSHGHVAGGSLVPQAWTPAGRPPEAWAGRWHCPRARWTKRLAPRRFRPRPPLWPRPHTLLPPPPALSDTSASCSCATAFWKLSSLQDGTAQGGEEAQAHLGGRQVWHDAGKTSGRQACEPTVCPSAAAPVSRLHEPAGARPPGNRQSALNPLRCAVPAPWLPAQQAGLPERGWRGGEQPSQGAAPLAGRCHGCPPPRTGHRPRPGRCSAPAGWGDSLRCVWGGGGVLGWVGGGSLAGHKLGGLQLARQAGWS